MADLDSSRPTFQEADPHATGARAAPPSVYPRTLAELGRLPAPPTTLPDVEGYEMLGRIGRGGMGVVYKARHRKLDRMVALKMVLDELEARPTDLVRFLAETEVVAKLQHPNIVQIYEAGQHAGRLYFAMEYVAGGSLAERLDGKPWPDVRAAAELVETVARAVHHAHGLGIIHRDLKPANILLAGIGGQGSGSGEQGQGLRAESEIAGAATSPTPDPRSPAHLCLTPKITDFGLAKLVQADTDLTRTGDLLGTPSYMAPELAAGRGRQTTFATDVYGLGAILYQLLTGKPPHKGLTVLETLELVKHQEPSSPHALRPELPRDLDTICLKCLQKDPHQRYATADALADDLRRFLNDEPIAARPITNGERLWRWCRRNPRVATLSAALLSLLIVGLMVTTLLWRQAVAEREAARSSQQEAEWQKELAVRAAAEADRQRRLADQEARTANKTVEVLGGLFEAADPVGINGVPFFIPKAAGEELSATAILERGLERVSKDLETEPAARAKLLNTIGNVYLTRGEYDRAEGPLLEAFELQKRLPADHPDRALGCYHVACLHHEKGNYAAARPLYEEALRSLRGQPEPNPGREAGAMFRLAWLLTQMEEYEEAEALYWNLIDFREGTPALQPDQHGLALTKFGLAALYIDKGDVSSAMEPSAQAILLIREAVGLSRLADAAFEFQQAMIQREVFGNLPQALTFLKKALASTQRVLGPQHSFAALILHEEGMTLEQLKRPAEAEAKFAASMDIARKNVGLLHPKVNVLLANYCSLLQDLKRASDADALIEETLAVRRGRLGPNHHLVADLLLLHGELFEERGDVRNQERRLREALELYRQTPGQPRRAMVDCLHSLALCLGVPRAAEAEALLLEALKLRRTFGASKGPSRGDLLASLGGVYLNQGRLPDAERLLREALDRAESKVEAPSDLCAVYTKLGRVCRLAGKPTEAVTALLDARSHAGTDRSDLFAVACEFAECAMSQVDPVTRDELAGLAVETLALAGRAGYRNVRELEQSDSLKVLRVRADFQELLTSLRGGKR